MKSSVFVRAGKGLPQAMQGDRVRRWQRGGARRRAPLCLGLVALALFVLAALPRVSWAERAESLQSPPDMLDIDGIPPVYFYPALDRRHPQPIVMYLHGRGGYPMQDCMKWSKVARSFGWLVCPAGPENRGGGARAWANNWLAAKNIVDKVVAHLRKKEGRRVQLRGNTLIGFSEGAFIAMNLGVRDPEVWNRWLILAASDSYWGGEGQVELEKNGRRVKRVYLLTGQLDNALGATERVFNILDKAGVHVMMRTPEDLGHEIPGDRMRLLYRRPLSWLNR